MTPQEYIDWFTMKINLIQVDVKKLNYMLTAAYPLSAEEAAQIERQRDDLQEGMKFYAWMIDQECKELRLRQVRALRVQHIKRERMVRS